MLPSEPEPGASVMIRTAYDEWIEAEATTGVEGTHRDGRKVHNFPVVWVRAPGSDKLPLSWPAEDVRVSAHCRHGHVCLVNAGHLLHPLTLDVCDLGAEGEGDEADR